MAKYGRAKSYHFTIMPFTPSVDRNAQRLSNKPNNALPLRSGPVEVRRVEVRRVEVSCDTISQ